MDNIKNELYLQSLLHFVNKLCDKPVESSSGEEVNEFERYIQEASQLASGLLYDVDNYRCKTSLLQNIGKSDWKSNYFIPLKKLGLDKTCFPTTSTDNDREIFVLKDLVNDIGYIKSDDTLSFAETLLNILFRHTVNIAASEGAPDISLYDHIKTTAAIVNCLYEHLLSGEEGAPFIIIGGDMSGIQGYIYDIISKYAGKNLKGRSFYLRLLSDAVVRFIIQQLDLTRANIIYNSGGSFYLLAPNTKVVIEKLNKATETIEHNFFKEHGVKLFMAIDYVELTKETLLHQGNQTLGQTWHKIFERRDKKKQSRMATYLQSHYDDFFLPILRGGNVWRDATTGEESLIGEKPYQHPAIKGLGNMKEINGKQIVLGKLLRDTDVMVVSDRPLNFVQSEDFSPADMGIHYYFLTNKEIETYYDLLQELASHVELVTFNGRGLNCDFMFKRKGNRNICSLEFYGGNDWNGNTFEDMCDNNGFERLGVLRMDVDNLGSIFQQGIDNRKATLSRYAELSRTFDWFFSGYINYIQKETAKDKTVIIYSGGDDLFIVGDWKETINMAKRIRNDFRQFTCNNPAFSISGGIAIVSDKFPIMKAAIESADEEDNAKSHQCKGQSKNSISFMGMALNWDCEFRQVEMLKDTLVNMLYRNELNKSFISKVMSHWMNADFNENTHNIQNMKTYWMLTYDLGRMKERTKNEEVKSLISNCAWECCSNAGTLNGNQIKSDYHALELWAFASRWAELEYRTI